MLIWPICAGRTSADQSVFRSGTKHGSNYETVALAGADTRGPGGFLFCESHVARATGERTVRVDRIPGRGRSRQRSMALRCARGERGATTIRRGRRTVQLTGLGGIVAWFDPLRAIDTAARLAAAVQDAGSLAEADAILEARGVRTELAYERELAQ